MRSISRAIGLIVVSPTEPSAVNSVCVSDRLLYSASSPRTADILRGAGIDAYQLDMSGTEKAEGDVTCCGVIFHA